MAENWPGRILAGGAAQPQAQLPGAGTDLPARPAPQQWPGRPVAELRAASGPVAESMGRPILDDPARMPGLGGQALASLPEPGNIDARIRAYSQSSGLPVGRFGIQGGRIFAVGRDGVPFYVEPQTPSISGQTGFDPGNLSRWVASGAGPAIPALAATGASIATAPLPGLAAIGAAGVAGAAGDAARQGLAGALIPGGAGPFNYATVAREGVLSAAGEGLGRAARAAFTRNPAGISAWDARAAASPQTQAQARAAQAAAGQEGVDLSLGQATNLRSAREVERGLASTPASADVMQQFYERQRRQLATAADRFTGTLARPDMDEAARVFRAGAEQVPTDIRVAGNRAARQLYQAAEPQQVPGLSGLLQSNPILGDALARVRKDAVLGAGLAGVADDTVRVGDAIKRQLDDAIGAALRAGENNRARLLREARDDLMGVLGQVPEYSAALAAARPGQRLAAQLQDTVTGRVGATGDDMPARTLTAPMFDFRRVSPLAVREARQAFEQAGQQEAWAAGLKAYLQSRFMEASAGQGGMSPLAVRRAMWGDERARTIMREAMTPDQFRGFDHLMRVFEYAARTLPEGSGTTNIARGIAAAETAAGGWRASAAGLLGNVFSPMRLADAAGRMSDRVQLRMTAEGMERLAGVVTSPNSIDALRRLRLMSPNSQRAVDAAAQLFVQGTATAAGSMLRIPPQDRQPTDTAPMN